MTENAQTPEAIEYLPELLQTAVAQGDGEQLTALLSPLTLADALREVLEFDSEDRSTILTLIPPDLAAEIIEEAPHETGADLMEILEAARAIEIMDELDSDVQADLIGDMEEEEAEAILSGMDQEDAADVRRLAEYEDDTAGGLMMSEVFEFSSRQTVGAVLKELAADDHDVDRYRGQHPYILDDEGRPIGVVSLRGLLSTKRTSRLTSIMVTPLTVPVDAPLTELEDIFDKHPFLGIPVVEHDGKLVGVVSREAVSQALLERAESENLKLQGVVSDELRSMPTVLRARRRLAWLSANIVLNMIAASVIAAYEETLLAVIAIAVFLPMVSDMSGCSGNQAVGVTMRELSLGLVRPMDAFKVWLKEISVGIINGIALGILIGIVAWVWKGNPALGLVIGLALCLNTMLAVSIGGVVPLLLKRIGQDPAVASGPLLTTVTDMAGFFFVLSLATVMMPWLI
ncbi:MAG: magnesium transporter [Pseudomonadota bacterium]